MVRARAGDHDLARVRADGKESEREHPAHAGDAGDPRPGGRLEVRRAGTGEQQPSPLTLLQGGGAIERMGMLAAEAEVTALAAAVKEERLLLLAGAGRNEHPALFPAEEVDHAARKGREGRDTRRLDYRAGRRAISLGAAG